jgi:hypothetical protein
MQVDENCFVVDCEAAITALGRWVRERFARHPYLVITLLDGLTRTLDQNAKLWPMLTDISQQVTWYGKKYSKDDWKTIITGSYRRSEFVPNVDGSGFVVLGMSTSKMNRKVFSDLIEFMYSFGASQDVKWSEKSEAVYQEFKQTNNAASPQRKQA